MTTSKQVGRSGTLVLVVGPSGVGKDALISYCRERLSGIDGVVFPRRAITRKGGDETEDHDTISEEEFERCAGSGGFALSWRAHGLCYGVPASAEDSLAAGRTVVINASRAVVDEARRRYRPLKVISVTADRDALAERLRRRGRESDDDITRRLERAAMAEVDGPDVVRLDNSGTLDEAGEALLRLLVESLE